MPSVWLKPTWSSLRWPSTRAQNPYVSTPVPAQSEDHGHLRMGDPGIQHFPMENGNHSCDVREAMPSNAINHLYRLVVGIPPKKKWRQENPPPIVQGFSWRTKPPLSSGISQPRPWCPILGWLTLALFVCV